MFRGNDGKLHVLVGDYVINAMHWMTLEGTKPTRQSSPARDQARGPTSSPRGR